MVVLVAARVIGVFLSEGEGAGSSGDFWGLGRSVGLGFAHIFVVRLPRKCVGGVLGGCILLGRALGEAGERFFGGG